MANKMMKLLFTGLYVSFNSGHYILVIKRQFSYINYCFNRRFHMRCVMRGKLKYSLELAMTCRDWLTLATHRIAQRSACKTAL